MYGWVLFTNLFKSSWAWWSFRSVKTSWTLQKIETLHKHFAVFRNFIVENGCGATGSKVELNGTQPKICYKNRMVPICGRMFWNTHYGAQLFCKMLGKANGIVKRSKEPLTEDAYVVGKCRSEDKDLLHCTGKCNLRTLGGDCKFFSGACTVGELAKPEVTCFGKIYFQFTLTYWNNASCWLKWMGAIRYLLQSFLGKCWKTLVLSKYTVFF